MSICDRTIFSTASSAKLLREIMQIGPVYSFSVMPAKMPQNQRFPEQNTVGAKTTRS